MSKKLISYEEEDEEDGKEGRQKGWKDDEEGGILEATDEDDVY